MIFIDGRSQRKDCKKLVEWCSRNNQQAQTNNFRQVITDLQRSLNSIGKY